MLETSIKNYSIHNIPATLIASITVKSNDPYAVKILRAQTAAKME